MKSQQYLSLIDSVMNGFEPHPNSSFFKGDQELNWAYKKALRVLAKDDQPFQYFTKPSDLRAVQRLWVPYR